jgi:hypothetical protein
VEKNFTPIRKILIDNSNRKGFTGSVIGSRSEPLVMRVTQGISLHRRCGCSRSRFATRFGKPLFEAVGSIFDLRRPRKKLALKKEDFL